MAVSREHETGGCEVSQSKSLRWELPRTIERIGRATPTSISCRLACKRGFHVDLLRRDALVLSPTFFVSASQAPPHDQSESIGYLKFEETACTRFASLYSPKAMFPYLVEAMCSNGFPILVNNPISGDLWDRIIAGIVLVCISLLGYQHVLTPPPPPLLRHHASGLEKYIL